MNIRAANVLDGYAIESLVKKCAEENTMMITASEAEGVIQRLVLMSNCHIYVAHVDNEIVGVIVGSGGMVDSESNNIEISICVSKKWRRMGVASMLLEIFIMKYGWMNIYANVVDGNQSIIKILESANFKNMCTLPNFVKTRSGFKDKLTFLYHG